MARRELAVPLVVLTRGVGRGGQAEEIREGLQQDQVTLSRRSCRVIAERSGHAIWLEQPEIVVNAIKVTVEASISSTAEPDCESIRQRGV